MLRPIVVALLLVSSGGCVTQHLWHEVVLDRPLPPFAPDVEPRDLVRAAHTPDGVLHVELRFSDGSLRHLTLAPAQESGAELVNEPTAYPEGATPARTELERWGSAYGPAHRPDDSPRVSWCPALRLVEERSAPERWRVATVPERGGDRRPPVPDRGPVYRVRVLGALALTPFTAVLDLVLAPLRPLLPVLVAVVR